MATRREIKRWMVANVADHTDRKTGEVNCTSLVEAWDYTMSDGGVTTDPDHEAWTIATEVAFEMDPS